MNAQNNKTLVDELYWEFVTKTLCIFKRSGALCTAICGTLCAHNDLNNTGLLSILTFLFRLGFKHEIIS